MELGHVDRTNLGATAPMDDVSVAGRLAQMDWSFHKSKATELEGIHPYPAKFIGEIPRTFIETLPIPDGTVVLDPFCGSGTTLYEAQRAGLQSIGIDLNPIACLIARVKTSPLASGFSDAVVEVVERARAIGELPPSNIPNVDHWFKQEVQVAVGGLAQTIASADLTPWADQLRLALSSILVRVSNQDSDTRYAAVENDVRHNDVFSLFMSAAQKIQRSLMARSWPLAPANVIQADTLTVQAEQIKANVGLVVTSPPYPNAYEYWLYHKYRMWWLGFDPIAVKEKEIGARAHFFKKNHHTAELFFDQMQATFELLTSVVVKDAFICFLVGRSKIHGQIVDNGDIIERVAQDCGLTLISRFSRVISATRKSFNLSHANIKSESVLVFQKTE